MTRLERHKINHLMVQMPPGVVLTLSWLKQQGISCKLAWWYVHSKWLERIGDEAYKKAGENLTWPGALSALQSQLHLFVHVGAKTALELLGQSHFVPMDGIKRVILFSEPHVKMPKWLFIEETWKVGFKVYTTSLFQEDNLNLGIVERAIDGIILSLSSPERAILEMLYLVPNKQSFDEVVLVMEGLRQLRPRVIQQLLEKCKSIKVKRIFLHLAERFQHPWLSELELQKINLGHGKRVIGDGGSYDPKYQISVPKIVEE
jgi:hypothetical protein